MWVFCQAKTQSAKICLNFHFSFSGGGGVRGGVFCTFFQNRVFLPISSKNSGSLACLCITDSFSHTTYVETKKFKLDYYDTTKSLLFACYFQQSNKQYCKSNSDKAVPWLCYLIICISTSISIFFGRTYWHKMQNALFNTTVFQYFHLWHK